MYMCISVSIISFIAFFRSSSIIILVHSSSFQLQEMTTQLEINSELKHKLQTVDDAYDLVDQEKARLEDNLNKMVQESLKQEQELRDTQQALQKYKDALHQTQESLRSTGSERDQVILEKVSQY